ncbi:hypothetical protein Sgou_26060 [Streptomyces gougerotii]|uniref:Uncharacterized protein n=2 Tax=Streptomyces diastaticus group TaxID=2849069 RepID=A0A8H9LRU3_9ACTN|nr:hypothetical protein Sdia_08170 [Streptomyces diastaticus subsp. diastaticus]GFH77936.1 hypothetical protein Sgou_26060 [Streptomyces gougerotii]GGU38303.1 hypothetical protein GCM10015534_46290 [Streptomyces diastaticus subsp. diastaticus]GGU89558.1 hypothetical protein GCM10010227_50850 [Streptomyces gougerotii]
MRLRAAAGRLAGLRILAFATRGPGQDVVRVHGHLPCRTPEGLRMGAAD